MVNADGAVILGIHKPEDRYHVPPSVDTLCFPYFFTKPFRNCSATSMVLSKEILMSRITFVDSSMVTQTQTNRPPILSRVSSIMNSEILRFFWQTFRGPYFCTHFHIATWFFLIILEVKALDVFLKERSRKYKYKPKAISLVGVLFLVFLKEKCTMYDLYSFSLS